MKQSSSETPRRAMTQQPGVFAEIPSPPTSLQTIDMHVCTSSYLKASVHSLVRDQLFLFQTQRSPEAVIYSSVSLFCFLLPPSPLLLPCCSPFSAQINSALNADTLSNHIQSLVQKCLLEGPTAVTDWVKESACSNTCTRRHPRTHTL